MPSETVQIAAATVLAPLTVLTVYSLYEYSGYWTVVTLIASGLGANFVLSSSIPTSVASVFAVSMLLTALVFKPDHRSSTQNTEKQEEVTQNA